MGNSDRAYVLLREYEAENADLPQALRRTMGMFYLIPLVGRDATSEVFGRDVGPTPKRHRAWFWWQVLSTSGLPHMWKKFADMRNNGVSMAECVRWLTDNITEEERALLLRRLGKKKLKASDYKRTPTTQAIWTKGGTWFRSSAITKLVLLGEPVKRDWTWKHLVAQNLGPEGCKKIERELYNCVDPDEMMQPEAQQHVLRYIRTRIQQLLGYKRNVSWWVVSWFLNTYIETPDGKHWDYRERYATHLNLRKTRKGRVKRWAW